ALLNGTATLAGVPLSPEAVARYAGKPVLAGIRPELFSVATGTADLDVEIDVVEPTGPDTLAVFVLGGVETVARLAPKSVRAKQRARLAVKTDMVVLFDPQTEQRID
ncbi:MAG: sugar ABC transporter ATP-binding protein, partial [Paracoccaceae bacterium]